MVKLPTTPPRDTRFEKLAREGSSISTGLSPGARPLAAKDAENLVFVLGLYRAGMRGSFGEFQVRRIEATGG